MGYIGSLTGQNTGSNLYIKNGGKIGSADLKTNAGDTTLINDGCVGKLKATDYNDNTRIKNNGGMGQVDLNAFNNGYIGFENNGRVGSLDATAKKGGQIDIDNRDGFMGRLDAETTGPRSGINIWS